MAARVTGLNIQPIIQHVQPRTSVSDVLRSISLESTNPILLQAPTGAGKTRSILDHYVPEALEYGRRILFISSRAAISAQFKVNLARKIGREDILTDYTPEGLRKLEEIGPVHILTYHALWARLRTHTIDLQRYDYLIWDEIHALTLDSTFVPYTGELLKRVIRASTGVRRIYLSATPEPILDKLAQWEGVPPLTVYKWKSDFKQYILHFYSGIKDISNRFQSLPDGEKALIFVSSIREGEALLKMLPNSELITSDTRKSDPEKWAKLLSSQELPARFTIATTTLDAGVSITDPALKHIVCESLDYAQILQEAGRKRLKSGEKLNIYLKSPTRQQLGNRLKRTNETLANLALCDKDQDAFIDRFILGDEQPEIRNMVLRESALCCQWDTICNVITSDAMRFHKFHVNPLAVEQLTQQAQLYTSLLAKKEERPFEKYICKLLKQPVPNDPCRWLDGRHSSSNCNAIKRFLSENAGKVFVTEEERQKFAAVLRKKYETAYGSRKGNRADRPIWGLVTIKKVLAELNLGYSMESDRGIWRLIDTRNPS